MSNCLVKKLKATVDISDTPIFDGFKIKVLAYTDNETARACKFDGATLIPIGNHSITDGVADFDNFDVKILNKYDINNVYIGANIELLTEDLKYCTEITEFRIRSDAEKNPSNHVSGKISDLKNCKKITRLQGALSPSDFDIPVKDLSNFPLLTDVSMGASEGLHGELLDMVCAYINNNRLNGTITFPNSQKTRLSAVLITFNGEMIPSAIGELTWSNKSGNIYTVDMDGTSVDIEITGDTYKIVS